MIVNDVDGEELKKPSIHSDARVYVDAEGLLEQLDLVLDRALAEGKGNLPEGASHSSNRQALDEGKGLRGMTWNRTCTMWKEKYPVILPRHFARADEEPANMYAFIHTVSSRLRGGQVAMVGSDSACVVGGRAYIIKKDQRFIADSAITSMRYGLPAAIGAWTASRDKGYYSQGGDRGGEDLILMTGDGSMQMNLQELQAIIHRRIRIKIFVINSEGYYSIHQTQKDFFGGPLIGIGVDSGDLSLPALDKLAAAYGYPHVSARHNSELREAVEGTLAAEGPTICKMSVSTNQNSEPKSSTERLPDSAIVLPPLEDLSPFLPGEEMDESVIIPGTEGQTCQQAKGQTCCEGSGIRRSICYTCNRNRSYQFYRKGCCKRVTDRKSSYICHSKAELSGMRPA